MFNMIAFRCKPFLIRSHLAEAALVDELSYRLEVGVTVRHVRLHEAEHLHRRRVKLDEHGVVDLAQAQQLQDLAHLGGDADDTADANHEHHVGLGWHVDVTGRLRLAAETDRVVLLGTILLHVALGALKDFLLLRLSGLGFRWEVMGSGAERDDRQ